MSITQIPKLGVFFASIHPSIPGASPFSIFGVKFPPSSAPRCQSEGVGEGIDFFLCCHRRYSPNRLGRAHNSSELRGHPTGPFYFESALKLQNLSESPHNQLLLYLAMEGGN